MTERPAPGSRPSATPRALVSFGTRGSLWAIDAALIEDVHEVSDVVPFPRAPHAVLGVMNARGSVVTLLDPGFLFEAGTGSLRPTAAVRLTAPNLHVALASDVAPQVLMTDERGAPSADGDSAAATIQVDGKAYTIVVPEEVLRRVTDQVTRIRRQARFGRSAEPNDIQAAP